MNCQYLTIKQLLMRYGFMTEIIKNIFNVKKNVTISQIAFEWLRANQNSFKRSTYQTYECIIKKYIVNSSLDNMHIEKLNISKYVSFSEQLLSNGLAPKTVNDIILILNSLLKHANKYFNIETVTAPYVKELKKEMRVLSVTEQNLFETYLYNDMDNFKFAALISLYTGIRIGELCALQWKDIRNGTIKINKTLHRLKDENGKSTIFIDSPKTFHSNRTIPIPLFLNSIVEDRRSNPESYVISNELIKVIEPRLMQIKFKKMTSECGLDNVTFHTLRHTFATRCVECGFDIKSLSEILGHADVKTTLNRYVHSSMELKQANMNKLNKIAM